MREGIPFYSVGANIGCPMDQGTKWLFTLAQYYSRTIALVNIWPYQESNRWQVGATFLNELTTLNPLLFVYFLHLNPKNWVVAWVFGMGECTWPWAHTKSAWVRMGLGRAGKVHGLGPTRYMALGPQDMEMCTKCNQHPGLTWQHGDVSNKCPPPFGCKSLWQRD